MKAPTKAEAPIPRSTTLRVPPSSTPERTLGGRKGKSRGSEDTDPSFCITTAMPRGSGEGTKAHT